MLKLTSSNERWDFLFKLNHLIDFKFPSNSFLFYIIYFYLMSLILIVFWESFPLKVISIWLLLCIPESWILNVITNTNFLAKFKCILKRLKMLIESSNTIICISPACKWYSHNSWSIKLNNPFIQSYCWSFLMLILLNTLMHLIICL